MKKFRLAVPVYAALTLSFALGTPISALAQLRGHGGPVRALAITSDGKNAISGSLDTSVIYWSLTRNEAEQVLRFHERGVNAVAFGANGRIITAGDDGRIALWAPGGQAPVRVLQGHTAPIMALAVSPDGKFIASASSDHTIRIWPLAGGNPYVFQGHQQNVNGVAFIDAKNFVSVSDDQTLRIWELYGGAPKTVTLPTALNTLAVSRDGEIIIGGASGRVFFISRDGEPIGEVAASENPIISVALSPDGNLIAATGIRSSAVILERKTRKVVRTLVGPGLPVWSAVFLPDNHTLLTGGADNLIRRWDARSGVYIGLVGRE